MAVSFDLFGTLVAVDRPDSPSEAVARQLRERGVAVPDDWTAAYREPQVDVAPGREYPLDDHVRQVLDSRGVDADASTVGDAVRAAFDCSVTTRDGAQAAVVAATEHGPVAVLSNCSVPGLVERVLDRSAVDADRFDAVVASVDCGWRKPDERAFATVATALDAPVERLVHVGDDPGTDGAAEAAGATSVLLSHRPLSEFPSVLEEFQCR